MGRSAAKTSQDAITMPSSVSLTIPGTPPSGNHYVKHTRTGRHYRTREAERWDWDVAAIAQGRQVRGKRYELTAQIWLGPSQKGDADNFLKTLQDSLVHAGVIDSDAKITDVHLYKLRDTTPRTVVTVEVIP